MNKSRILVLAATLSMGAAFPVLAAFDEIGAVDVSADHSTNASWSDFGGPVEQLSFLTDRADVHCDHITSNYRDGTSQDVFSGILYKGQRQVISFSDGSREIRDVDFDCRAIDADSARIALGANIGAYRSAWVSSPEWNSPWSHIVSPSDIAEPAATAAMTPIASPDFGVWGDRSIMLHGDGEENLNAIVLEPVGADAQCRRVTVMFDDSSSNDLVVNGGEPMRDGEIYRVDITGRNRNLNAIGLTCQAENNNAVTIRVFGVV